MSEPKPITREEFDEQAKLIVGLRDLQKQQAEDIKTQAEVMEQKGKMIDEKIAAHEAKKKTLVMDGAEKSGEFPKYDPLGRLSPLRRAYESTRPAQKRSLNLDGPYDELRLEFQGACHEAVVLARYFESRMGKGRYTVMAKPRKSGEDAEEFVNLRALEEVAPDTVAKVRHYAKHIDPEFARAMDTGTELAAWLPTIYSGQMIELIRTEYLVGGLFDHIAMPSATYELPVEGGDLTPTLVAQGTADPMADDWHVGAVTESDSTVASPALTAKKFGCRTVISDEATEDTIVPVLPYLARKHVIAHAFALDEAILDGQATAQIDTGISGGSMAATDRRKAWDGLRYIATQTKTGGNMDLSTFSYDNLVKLIGKMGSYQGRPQDSAFITSYSGLYNFMTLDEVLTLDKYGPSATIMTGELGKVLGRPIIVAPNAIWESLNATGIYDNSVTDYTCLLCVNLKGYVVGDRTGYTYKVLQELYAAHGMVGVVSFSRHGFADLFPAATQVTVAYGYKIGKA